MNPQPLLGADEHASYVRELAQLRAVRDRDLPELLRDARTFVASDAAEEMLQIQADQDLLGARIARLEHLLSSATIAPTDLPDDVVAIGRTVVLEYVDTSRRRVYRLAGVADARTSGIVSAGSPLGRALMGCRRGDLVTAELPTGRVAPIRILDVQSGERARMA